MKSKIFLDKPSFCPLFTQKGATVDVALPRSQHQRGVAAVLATGSV